MILVDSDGPNQATGHASIHSFFYAITYEKKSGIIIAIQIDSKSSEYSPTQRDGIIKFPNIISNKVGPINWDQFISNTLTLILWDNFLTCLVEFI